jgi:hypothetical protein
MKRTRLASAALAILAVPALALSLSAASSHATIAKSEAKPASKPATNPAAQQPAPEPVVVDCLSKGQVEPPTFVLTCADGNSYLTGLHWTTWNSEMAAATGTLVQNDCIPYCAVGHFHRYPALVVLWSPGPYGSVQRFTELTEILPGSRPLVYNGHGWVPAQRVETSQLWAPRI